MAERVEVVVELACDCLFSILIEVIDEPTEDEVVQAATNPGIEPGTMLSCDLHGRQVIVRAA